MAIFSQIQSIKLHKRILLINLLLKKFHHFQFSGDYGTKVLSEEASFKECGLDVECYIDVSPVHIDSPSQFCCHIVQNAVDFKKMTDELNEYYAKTSADHSVSWKKLMPCVALFDGMKSLNVLFLIFLFSFFFHQILHKISS